MYFAHSTQTADQAGWEPLQEHLRRTAGLARTVAAPLALETAAELAATLHDVGKYTEAFQRRLRNIGRADHSTAGARLALDLVKAPRDRLLAELVAYAVAGHHAGLPDRFGGEVSLDERLKRDLPEPDPVWREELDPPLGGLMPEGFRIDPAEAGFQFGLLGRMLFSCLVDADFLATEAFYDRAEGRERDRDWPALEALLPELLARYEPHMAGLAARGAGGVGAIRAEVLAHVRAKAAEAPGVFTLTVPTGGGKTLASLGFALDHARRHGLRRIVYAIPFTSIIDQTVEVFERVLGEGVALPHHSAFDEEAVKDRQGWDKLKLAMENWAAPVVVTTNVQLFESLFAARPSRCRKLHNLARSVLILDEAQTIPRPLLRPCVAALKELARNYGTTVVLCTATQPALAAPRFPGGFEKPVELAPEPARLARALRRTRFEFAGKTDDAALVEALRETPQGLVVVNSRRHALDLFRAAQTAELEGAIHLTTRQYPAHRRRILAHVRKRLAAGRPCRLIATSLVEAGVDLDFPRVWRATAGLDQIAQAAGRCNREGRRPVEDSVVTVFEPADHAPPQEIALLAGDFGRMADKFPDLTSPDAVLAFFAEVYFREREEGLDAKGILGDFRIDRRADMTKGLVSDFAYRTVADNFRMIESGLAPVIVAREAAARRIVGRLEHMPAGAAARALQPFVVQVPPKARRRLLDAGRAYWAEPERFGEQFAVLCDDGLYKRLVGLLWEDAEYLRSEELVI
jgi:CRISPR-associated endonuclease/helicase Cas3